MIRVHLQTIMLSGIIIPWTNIFQESMHVQRHTNLTSGVPRHQRLLARRWQELSGWKTLMVTQHFRFAKTSSKTKQKIMKKIPTRPPQKKKKLIERFTCHLWIIRHKSTFQKSISMPRESLVARNTPVLDTVRRYGGGQWWSSPWKPCPQVLASWGSGGTARVLRGS